MPAAVVDRDLRRRKRGIGKRPHGDTHRVVAALFGVEDGRPADRTEPEDESGALIADARVFSRSAEDLERSSEARQCGEDAAGPSLAGEAIADADASRLAFDLNAQLSAGAGSRSGGHAAPQWDVVVTSSDAARADPPDDSALMRVVGECQKRLEAHRPGKSNRRLVVNLDLISRSEVTFGKFSESCADDDPGLLDDAPQP
jgi:hypothetical protein